MMIENMKARNTKEKSKKCNSHTYNMLRSICNLVILIILLVTSEAQQDRQQNEEKKQKRYAVVNFVDESNEYLWGLYSTHVQLQKFNMTPGIQHIAMISQDISKESRKLVAEWLGDDGIREFDRSHILSKVPKRNLRQGVFLKLEAFNMTEFDKIIVLDNDILVRTNLEHWFNYPAPAATGARGIIEWNSGAMVIEPRTSLYDALLEYLPRTRRWMGIPKKDQDDTWNSNGGQQGFLSAFFLSNVTNDEMFTMSYGHSVLSSDLEERPHNYYFWIYRPHVFETIHFTRHKPWKPTIYTKHPVTCALLQEWKESVRDAPMDKLPKLPDVMKNCRPHKA
jgi:hypothetical protein